MTEEDGHTQPLPRGWAQSTLGEIGEYLNGRAFKRSEWSNTGRPIIRIQDLTGSRDTPNRFAGVVERRYEVQNGDLLISWAATLGVYWWTRGDAVLNQHIFKVKSFINPRFHYYLATHALIEVQRQTHGSGMVHVTKGKFDATPVKIPPLGEQLRIVSAIEEHLSRLDAAVSALHRAKSLIPSYRASVLESACSGRLAPAGATRESLPDAAEPESAADLVAGLETMLAGAGLAQRRAITESVSIRGRHLPKGWAWVPLGKLGMIQGGIQKQPSRRPVRNKYPFLRVANVARGALDLREVHEIELFPGEIERLELQRGDLLIVEGNGSPSEIGRMAEWTGAIDKCVHQNHLIRFRALPGVVSPYIAAFWNSPSGSRRVLEAASSTSGLYTLSVSKVASIAVPLPPTSEQQRIAQDVDRRTTVLSALSRQIDGELKRADRLRASILQRAFEGALVAQNTQDEPASVLLDRIRTERAVAVRPRKSRRTA